MAGCEARGVVASGAGVTRAGRLVGWVGSLRSRDGGGVVVVRDGTGVAGRGGGVAAAIGPDGSLPRGTTDGIRPLGRGGGNDRFPASSLPSGESFVDEDGSDGSRLTIPPSTSVQGSLPPLVPGNRGLATWTPPR